MWTRRDIVEKLIEKGIEPTEDVIGNMLTRDNLKYLKEQSVSAGYDVINAWMNS